LFSGTLSAQTDSAKLLKYSPDFKFAEGIYLNFYQLKSNTPIPKTRIISNEDYSSVDFFNKLVQNEKIKIFDSYGMQQDVLTKEIWGYCRNGAIYINWNGDFSRIPVLGSVCHFVADKTVYRAPDFDPYYYNSYNYNMRAPSTTATTEMQQYILDFETEKVYEYNQASVEVVLMRDPQLYDEFNALSRKKKSQSLFLYIRKYNEKHPLYFIGK